MSSRKCVKYAFLGEMSIVNSESNMVLTQFFQEVNIMLTQLCSESFEHNDYRKFKVFIVIVGDITQA